MQQPARPIIVKEEYHDNWIDRLFIWLFSRKISQALGRDTTVSGYGGFVDLSKQAMQGRNAQEQQIIIAPPPFSGPFVPSPPPPA
jgi:hypothetical protein